MAVNARKVHTLVNYKGTAIRSRAQMADTAKRPVPPFPPGVKVDVLAAKRRRNTPTL